MKKILLLTAVITGFYSCKKSEVPAEKCSTSNTTIAGVYTISSIKYKESADASETDEFADVAACSKDDTYELNPDGSIVITDAGVVCDLPANPGPMSGWSLQDNNSRLYLDQSIYTIESFDCSTLVVSMSSVIRAGDKRIITYKKRS